MPYRLNGGTFKGTVDLYADDGIYEKINRQATPILRWDWINALATAQLLRLTAPLPVPMLTLLF